SKAVAGQGLTNSGAQLGSTHFVSPEQDRDPRSATVRSDIWSLGATLHYLVTGRWMNTFRERDTPEMLVDVILKSTEHVADRRYASMEEFARALRQLPGLPAQAGRAAVRPPVSALAAVADSVPAATSARHSKPVAHPADVSPERPGERRSAQQSSNQNKAKAGANSPGSGSVLSNLLNVLKDSGKAALQSSVPKVVTSQASASATPLQSPFSASAARSGQLAWARSAGRDVEFTNPLGMTFRLVPAGTFLMGSPPGVGFPDEQPQHQVTLSRAFYLGQTTVTQGQWQQLMGTAPWRGRDWVIEGPEVAATYVSWDDAVKFCQRISEREGRRYRLPTEAEWEYACRAGTTTAYSFGDDERRLGRHAWYAGNARSADERYAHAVGKKVANPFGLYDMHGNVWEWVQDWNGSYGESSATDPTGPRSGSSRVLRGGSWNEVPIDVRSGYRNNASPDLRYYNIGLRLCVEL
ncbi:MAG: hypothetical protein RLZZ458_1653, partial [Planctomycetota bacterium]